MMSRKPLYLFLLVVAFITTAPIARADTIQVFIGPCQTCNTSYASVYYPNAYGIMPVDAAIAQTWQKASTPVIMTPQQYAIYQKKPAKSLW